MKKLILAATGLMALGGSAFAADMAAPVYKAPPPPAPVYSWSGCYIDGGVGYGMWDADHFGTTAAGPFDLSSTSGGRGWLGRAGAGCDYQVAPKWVIGAFGDYDFMNIHGNAVDPAGVFPFGVQATEKENWAWAAGARLGYELAPGVLTYVDGGYTETHFQQAALITTVGGVATGLSLAGQTYNGWFLGSGFETSLASWLPGLPNGLFLRTEYRFSSFGAKNDPVIATPVIPAPGSAENIHPYVQTVTTSLVWRFNLWH